MNEHSGHKSGFVALVGRPNVGKSTAILGQKISITSPRPQTTRQRLLGIKTTPRGQAVYVDTPGLHKGAKRAINQYMNRAATAALADVDVIVFVVEGTRWTDEDDLVLQRIKESRAPVILVVNKVDKVKDKRDLLPHLKILSEKHDFAEIIPLAAIRGEVAPLEDCSPPTRSPTRANASWPPNSSAKSSCATSARKSPTASPWRSNASTSAKTACWRSTR